MSIHQKLYYQHWKGGLYELVCTAVDEATGEELTIYKAADGSIWSRPSKVFHEMVAVGPIKVPRFSAVGVGEIETEDLSLDTVVQKLKQRNSRFAEKFDKWCAEFKNILG